MANTTKMISFVSNTTVHHQYRGIEVTGIVTKTMELGWMLVEAHGLEFVVSPNDVTLRVN